MNRAELLHLAKGRPELLRHLAGPSLAPAARAAHPIGDEGRQPIVLTLPWPPPLNHLYRTWRGRVLLSTEGRAYKTRVGLLALGASPLVGPVAVSLTLFRPRKAGDIDGPLKLALDVLQGVAFVNDSQIVAMHVFRLDDKYNPRIVATVSASEVSA